MEKKCKGCGATWDIDDVLDVPDNNSFALNEGELTKCPDCIFFINNIPFNADITERPNIQEDFHPEDLIN